MGVSAIILKMHVGPSPHPMDLEAMARGRANKRRLNFVPRKNCVGVRACACGDDYVRDGEINIQIQKHSTMGSFL